MAAKGAECQNSDSLLEKPLLQDLLPDHTEFEEASSILPAAEGKWGLRHLFRLEFS